MKEKIYVIAYATPEYEILLVDPPLLQHEGRNVTCIVRYEKNIARAFYEIADFFRNDCLFILPAFDKDGNIIGVDYDGLLREYRNVPASEWLRRMSLCVRVGVDIGSAEKAIYTTRIKNDLNLFTNKWEVIDDKAILTVLTRDSAVVTLEYKHVGKHKKPDWK